MKYNTPQMLAILSTYLEWKMEHNQVKLLIKFVIQISNKYQERIINHHPKAITSLINNFCLFIHIVNFFLFFKVTTIKVYSKKKTTFFGKTFSSNTGTQ